MSARPNARASVRRTATLTTSRSTAVTTPTRERVNTSSSGRGMSNRRSASLLRTSLADPRDSPAPSTVNRLSFHSLTQGWIMTYDTIRYDRIYLRAPKADGRAQKNEKNKEK